jgi:hypothetical protein
MLGTNSDKKKPTNPFLPSRVVEHAKVLVKLVDDARCLRKRICRGEIIWSALVRSVSEKKWVRTRAPV